MGRRKPPGLKKVMRIASRFSSKQFDDLMLCVELQHTKRASKFCEMAVVSCVKWFIGKIKDDDTIPKSIINQKRELDDLKKMGIRRDVVLDVFFTVHEHLAIEKCAEIMDVSKAEFCVVAIIRRVKDIMADSRDSLHSTDPQASTKAKDSTLQSGVEWSGTNPKDTP